MPRTGSQTGAAFLADLQPHLGAISATAGLAVALLSLVILNLREHASLWRALREDLRPTEPRRAYAARSILRFVTLPLACLFLLSALLNLGVQIPLGFTDVSFQAPSSSIAAFEIVIALVLFAAAGSMNLYLCGGAYLFAVVGISAGLISGDIQGLARALHEAMVPFVVAGWPLIAVEANRAYEARTQSGTATSSREIVTALQFFVGALVTLGGAAFVRGGVYPVGTALGAVHLIVGLTGLLGGYFFLRKEPWSRSFLIAIDSVTIAYSAFAETLVEIFAYLPPGISDSLIGTLIAITVSIVIIYMLTRRAQTWHEVGGSSENRRR